MWVDVCRERVVRMVNIITESIMVDTNMPIVGDISECLLFLIFFSQKCSVNTRETSEKLK